MFFRCPKQRDDGQCPFFQWEDELQPGTAGVILAQWTSPAGRAAPGAGSGGNACFKCGQVHILL